MHRGGGRVLRYWLSGGCRLGRSHRSRKSQLHRAKNLHRALAASAAANTTRVPKLDVVLLHRLGVGMEVPWLGSCLQWPVGLGLGLGCPRLELGAIMRRHGGGKKSRAQPSHSRVAQPIITASLHSKVAIFHTTIQFERPPVPPITLRIWTWGTARGLQKSNM